VARSKTEHQAHEFAEKIQRLLNKTVADNARVLAGLDSGRGYVAVGTHLTRTFDTRPVQLLTADTSHRLFLDVQCQVYLEEGTDYLTMQQSYFGIAASIDAANPLFHYDYQRDKQATDGYTEAHLQVFGNNTELEPIMQALCKKRKKKQMGELHFPVGGRRFRPALEDVLEFLIDEQLVSPKQGWEAELEKTRHEFRMIQLKTMVRRYPDEAREALNRASGQRGR
jgi:hypothetical protein